MRSRILLIVIALASTAGWPGAETLAPLSTEDAALLPVGHLEVVLGTEGRLGGPAPFESTDRDEWSAPLLSVRAGLGTRAEARLSVEGVAASFRDEDLTSEYGVGDARLFTKVRVWSEGEWNHPWLPAAAIRFGVKIPNANNRRRLGTDQTDLFANGLLGKTLAGDVRLHLGVGIGIFGNPGPTRGQDDVLFWGVGLGSPRLALWPDAGLRLFAEGTGIEGGRFDLERRRAVGGFRFEGERLGFYAGAGAGLDERSEEVLVRAGVIATFDLDF